MPAFQKKNPLDFKTQYGLGFDPQDDEIVVDFFCGGGGAGTGLEMGLGRPVTIAKNHSPATIRRAPAVISRCRDDIVSPYLVHRRPDHKKQKQAPTKDHWTQVEERYLTRAFKEAREAADCYKGWKEEEMPGFHEVRHVSLWHGFHRPVAPSYLSLPTSKPAQVPSS